MMSLPVIKIGSLTNSGAMSVARMMGARLLLSVSLTQLAMPTSLVMAQSFPPPFDSDSLSPPKGFSTLWGVIVGVVVAVVFVKILVILSVFVYCLRKNRERAGHANDEEARLATTEQTPPRTQTDFDAQVSAVCQTPNMDVVPQQDVAYSMDFRKYSYGEVEAISSNWKNKIGQGGFGPVYLGEIFSDGSPNADPQEVALKRLSPTSQQGKDEFLNEVRLLSRIHFRYLVPLVGFCDETNNQVLIYEYVQKGSLADWLHGAQRGHPDFSWYNRLHIARHAALGLDYLHVGASPNIIHRDVKSSNILITREWEGRVADFGLSKTSGISDRDQQRTHMTTSVKGTRGYLDPEYLMTGKFTTKSDVYSFGIVLLELVTGHLPIDCPEGNPQFRIKRYVQSHDPHNLATIADPSLKGNYDMRSMQKIVQVALRSVASQGINRPTMSNVVFEIQKAMELGRDSPATTNTQDSLTEPATGPGTKPAIRTPHAFASGQTRSRPGSSLLSTASSSATSVPSIEAFPQ